MRRKPSFARPRQHPGIAGRVFVIGLAMAVTAGTSSAAAMPTPGNTGSASTTEAATTTTSRASGSALRALLATNAEPPPSVEEVMPGAVNATPAELQVVAEAACEKGQLDPRLCAMSEPQMSSLLPGLEKETLELTRQAEDAARIEGTTGARTVAGVSQALTKFLSASKNPAVKELTNKADKYATWASNLSIPAGMALEGTTVKEVGKAACYVLLNMTPPLGDLYSLADSVAHGNIEQGVIAVLGVAAFAIGLTFPPAGAVIAVGLAVYNVGKVMWNFFLARHRNWVTNPVDAAKELFNAGASLKWTQRTLKGKPAHLIFSENTLVATQSLILDSKWTKYNRDSKPVTYTIPSGGGIFYEGEVLTGATLDPIHNVHVGVGPTILDAALVIWQDNKAHAAECKVIRPYVTSVIDCGNLSSSVTIAHNKPAVLELAYTLNDYEELRGLCPAPDRPCTTDNLQYNSLEVTSAGKPAVQLRIPSAAAIV